MCSCKELREIELESAVALLEHELAEKENAICKLTSQIKEARSNAAADAFLILQLLGVKGGKDTKDNETQYTAQSPSYGRPTGGLTCHTAQHMGDVRIPLKARYKHTKNTDTQIASQSPSHSDSADGLTLKHNERIGDVKPRYTVHHWRPTYRFAGDQEAGLTKSAVSSDLLQSNIIAGKRKRTAAHTKDIRHYAYSENEVNTLLSLSSVCSSYLSAYNS